MHEWLSGQISRNKGLNKTSSYQSATWLYWIRAMVRYSRYIGSFYFSSVKSGWTALCWNICNIPSFNSSPQTVQIHPENQSAAPISLIALPLTGWKNQHSRKSGPELKRVPSISYFFTKLTDESVCYFHIWRIILKSAMMETYIFSRGYIQLILLPHSD